MQKQIDELKQGQANTYSARDLLLDMRERQDRLERQIYASPVGRRIAVYLKSSYRV